MALAVRLPCDLVVIHIQLDATVRTTEAVRMEFFFSIGLQVLPLNTLIALAAQTTIQLMVMSRTVWRIAMHVELGTWEWSLASLAHEAFPMVAASQTPISCLDRLAIDVRAATFAFTLGSRLLEARRLAGIDIRSRTLTHAWW